MTGVGISNKPEQGIAMHQCKILPTRLCTLISFCEEKGEEEWELWYWQLSQIFQHAALSHTNNYALPPLDKTGKIGCTCTFQLRKSCCWCYRVLTKIFVLQNIWCISIKGNNEYFFVDQNTTYVTKDTHSLQRLSTGRLPGVAYRLWKAYPGGLYACRSNW